MNLKMIMDSLNLNYVPKTSSSTFGADRMQKACFMSKCRQKSAKV